MLLALVYWYCIPVSAEANRFPSWLIPNLSWTPWWLGSIGPMKNIQHSWRPLLKNQSEILVNQVLKVSMKKSLDF